MTATTYQPRHQRGAHIAPVFDSATAACLWIIAQKTPADWTWC